MWEHTVGGDTKTSVSLGLKYELSVRDDLVEPARYNIRPSDSFNLRQQP